MKRVFTRFLLIAMTAMTVCFSSMAMANVEMRIGIIDTQALKESPQYAAAQARMKKEFEPRQKKLEAEQKTLQTKHEALQRNQDILSESEKIAKEREVTKLQQKFQRMVEEYEGDFRAKEQEELVVFQKLVNKVIENVAKEEKYDLILPSHLVLFNNDKVNFTDKVLKALEKDSKS